jgi:hypothetical protein
MTATPRYFTGKVKRVAKEREFEVASMDDPQLFGPEFFSLGFPEAIDRDLLCDYQVVIVGVDHETYRNYAKNGEVVTADGKETDARTLAAHIALAKAMKRYDLSRVISFHSRVKRAKEFAADFPSVVKWLPGQARPKGEIWSEHISGKMTTDKRNVLLRTLRKLGAEERGLLCNARCLTEGVDVPTLDGVAFVDPRRSQIDIVQAVGRAIRKADDKTVGTILIPVFIASIEDPETELATSEFERVWAVISALRDHDEDLAESLDECRRQHGRRRVPGKPPPKIKFDLPRTVGAAFSQAFEARLLERTTANWEFWYGVAQSFASREGHSLVPAKHIEEGQKVGAWVSAQRNYYRKGQLSDERQALLEELPGWVWVVTDASWSAGLEALASFAARESHVRVPLKHKEGLHKLGQWVVWARSTYNAGNLSGDRARDLEKFAGWSWDTLADKWSERFELLKQFAIREGTALVPSGHTEDGYPLDRWVVQQRTRHKAGRLSADRAEALEGLAGWAWNARDARWELCFAGLLRFVARMGHARVPKGHVEDGIRLRDWVNNQRSTRAKLRPERYERLDRVPGWIWQTRGADWEKHLEVLRTYVRREGHASVPAKHVEAGLRLGRWVSGQRTGHATMGAKRRDLLEGVTGWKWEAASD